MVELDSLSGENGKSQESYPLREFTSALLQSLNEE